MIRASYEPMTPESVRSATFTSSRLGRRGLDEAEVRAFCADVSDGLGRLLNDNSMLAGGGHAAARAAARGQGEVRRPAGGRPRPGRLRAVEGAADRGPLRGRRAGVQPGTRRGRPHAQRRDPARGEGARQHDPGGGAHEREPGRRARPARRTRFPPPSSRSCRPRSPTCGRSATCAARTCARTWSRSPSPSRRGSRPSAAARARPRSPPPSPLSTSYPRRREQPGAPRARHARRGSPAWR